MDKKIIIMIISVILAIALLVGGSLFVYQKYFKKSAEQKTTRLQERNYYEINDELAGVSFKISKKFDRMPAQLLQVKNPSFIYGFYAKDDNSISCFISQTKKDQSGAITVGQLRDGVFEQLKKINPDAKIDEAKIIDVGENNNKGVKLKMNYTETDKTPMLQWEVTGITNERATFAFCICPKAVVELYREDFDLFLDSVKIK